MTTTAIRKDQGEPEIHNPYLEGNYAPVDREVTATQLDVTGTIPDYLDGRYLRNGPNPITVDRSTYEWFTGAGMVHGLRIRDGKAEWYRNRWVRSGAVARDFGEKWPGGPLQGGLDFASNTNVIGHAGRTLAITEAGVTPYELNDELETVGPFDFCGTLRGGYTAHPKRDPVSGELHAVSYSPFHGNRVQYTVTGTDGLIKRAIEIPLGQSPMMHDFSLTERYVVLYDLPVVLDLAAVFKGKTMRTIATQLTKFATKYPMPGPMESAVQRASRLRAPDVPLPYHWDPKHRARVGVLPRDGVASDIRWFDVGQCYVYHPLNAYDDGDRIVLDVVRHTKVFDGTGPIGGPTTLDRWTVDLTAGQVREERLDDRVQEFPRVDERLVGKRHRYGYAVGHDRDQEGFPTPDSILKHDLTTQSTETVRFGRNSQPGEFVFAPRTADAAEDDGVLMGFVYNADAGKSDLVFLDAASLETVATVHLPARVPNGFHGNWIES
ncbi:carotenoid oxygenase family protein [Antrihabitans sp. YC2-6]|uniref:carotenoid oxygenase family protein n=1 Tax=Antrihabitans sp. YC2-6 TaxID=2799498 RepID=UPI0018F6B4A9|nr:carotenoid oxygenase family protein [Antrihabitans sp. YC2-6]MBJ8346311.1 carotenoid oxygenase family protein [Antrihabitans sp. YC2-6]